MKNDNLDLEKTIQRQEIELQHWKEETERLAKIKTDTEQELSQVQKDFDSYHHQIKTKSNSRNFEIRLNFKDEIEKKNFINKVSSLAHKYEMDKLLFVLNLCVDYTIKNDKSLFILKTVKEFFQKNLSNSSKRK